MTNLFVSCCSFFALSTIISNNASSWPLKFNFLSERIVSANANIGLIGVLNSSIESSRRLLVSFWVLSSSCILKRVSISWLCFQMLSNIVTKDSTVDLLLEYAAKPIALDRKSTRLNSSHANISYAVFCLQHNNIHDLVH